MRQQTLRLAELGYFYKQIKSYCDGEAGSGGGVGLMALGLKHALDLELQEYYRLLAIVQGQVQVTLTTTTSTDHQNGKQKTIVKDA
jgi:hypothetical protein